MKNEVASERGIKIILNYVKKDYSWKESYFEHFSKGQKFLFFLPVLFLFLPVYGTYDLFHNHSWFLFISLGLVMLLSIWWFHKQKTYFENMIIVKYYSLKNGSTISDYHKQKLKEALGELNTKENRSLWLTYFDGKMKNNRKVIGIAVFFAIFYFSQFSTHHKQDYLLIFYMLGIALLALLMTVVFIMPAFVNFKNKMALHYQAHRLVLELDKD